MKTQLSKRKKRRGVSLLLSIVLVFCVLGTVVYTVSRKISEEMYTSAIQNLSESLDLIQCTIEAILRSEAEFQLLIAQEIARVEDPEDIGRLSETLSTLSEENGVMVDLNEDFPEHMRDWTLEWLSREGESQALVEISRVGTVFRGDQCFNLLGGEIFNMDYLRGLLLGLPEDSGGK